MKQLLISALFLCCVTISRAQTIPNEKVVISVKANTASVSFTVRTLANVILDQMKALNLFLQILMEPSQR